MAFGTARAADSAAPLPKPDARTELTAVARARGAERAGRLRAVAGPKPGTGLVARAPAKADSYPGTCTPLLRREKQTKGDVRG